MRPRLGRLASSVEHVERVGSTNDIALARAAALAHPAAGGERSLVEGLVVVADEQTAGRGRRGHVWVSPLGAGLYVSVVLVPGGAAGNARRATSLLTLAAGVAIAEGVEAATGLRASLKWPNDLLVARRKLAGILAEAAGDAVVLGYGINIAAAAFPPELSGRITSLQSELGREIDRFDVLGETLAALAARYDDLLAGRFHAILERWRELAPAAHGARVVWTTSNGPLSGVTAGVDDDGALLVDVGGATHRIVGGEVGWL